MKAQGTGSDSDSVVDLLFDLVPETGRSTRAAVEPDLETRLAHALRSAIRKAASQRHRPDEAA